MWQDMNEEIVRKLCEETAAEKQLIVVEFLFRGTPKMRVIELYLDGLATVTVDDCAEISRTISAKIDEAGYADASYRLDVSSPGTDRPLIQLIQYPKHIGRTLELTYTSGETEQKLKGTLTAVEDQTLVFETKSGETRIQFQDISKAKVIISFS